MSPSLMVWIGRRVRARPSCAICAILVASVLVTTASVATTASVVALAGLAALAAAREAGCTVSVDPASTGPLIAYGVAKARGIAFGFGLQAIEASVGVGVGMLFLAHEGLSFAMLRVMPGAEAVELPEDESPAAEPRERARITG